MSIKTVDTKTLKRWVKVVNAQLYHLRDQPESEKKEAAMNRMWFLDILYAKELKRRKK
jgi:hypothetical protein